MESVFFHIVGVSVTISIVVVFLLLLSSYLNDRYTVKWRYFLWLFLAIRLMIPFDFGFTAPPLEMKFNDREIVAAKQETGAADVRINDQAVLDADYPVENESGNTTPVVSARDTEETAYGSITVSQIATGIYLAGIAVFLLRQLGTYLFFRRSAKRWYREVSNKEIMDTFYDLENQMGIVKPFKVRICRKILSPMITGLFRPTLLIPHEEYEKADLEVILKHELIHFRRNDLWFKLLLISANALHWFNPFIYIMVREANRDIEISCDEEVLKGADLPLRKRYSERILELMQGNNLQEAPVSTNFHGGKGMMKSRIRSIFDERVKKKGVLSFLAILALVVIFSACSFDIGQNNWKINLASAAAESARGGATASLTFDQDHNGTVDSEFNLFVEGETVYLNYNGADGKTARKQILKGVESGFDYSLHAANLEDGNSIEFIAAIDYRGMPFGSGYWELYSWNGSEFKQIDTKSVEENLQMKILEPTEVRNNVMNAETAAYLYDVSKYSGDYPSVGLYFKDAFKEGGQALSDITYAPMTDYDVEGYHTWGQGAVNKIMTGMRFTSGDDVEGWTDSSRALLETEEVVFITLPNITATVKSYYEYRNGEWSVVDRIIE